jgi:hypothetical protein
VTSLAGPRECPICGTVFIRRSDTKTCGKACGTALRERGYAENGRPQVPKMAVEEQRERLL